MPVGCGSATPARSEPEMARAPTCAPAPGLGRTATSHSGHHDGGAGYFDRLTPDRQRRALHAIANKSRASRRPGGNPLAWTSH